MNTNRITIIRRDAGAAAEIAACLADAGRAAFARSGRFSVAVSAAALDESLVAALAAAPLRHEPFWRGTRLFLADTWLPERVVPWRHLRAAIGRLPLAPGHAHLEVAAGPSAVAAASAYEQELRAVFSLATGELPRFDLCLLALGPNGRLGGLAPGGRACDEIGRLVVADFVPATRGSVVTLTPPVIQNAAAVLAVAVAPDRLVAPFPQPLAPLADPARS